MSTRDKLNKLISQHTHYTQCVETETLSLSRLKERERDILTAQNVVQTVAESIQEQAHKRIANLVTKCLHAVYGDSDDAYDFQIKFEQKRGKTEASLLFVRNGNEIEPTTGSGGGPIDVAAFALRLACIMLSQPNRRKLLVIDEGFRMVSSVRSPAIRQLLTTLATELGFQFVLVTHNNNLQTGSILEIDKGN